MSLAVHRLGDDRVVVARDDGRRWVLDVGPHDLDGEAARSALATLADRGGAAAPAGPPVGTDEVATSVRHLERIAAALDGDGADGAYRTDSAGGTPGRVVRWPFAGATYRLRLRAGGAAALAGTVSAVLRATIADADQAEALVEDPVRVVHAKPAAPRHAPPSDASETGPAPGVLERWTSGGWEPHVVEPPPTVDPVTGLLRRVVRRAPDARAPRAFVHLHAELPTLASVDPRWQPDLLAPAGALDGQDAERAAVLSGLAHLCGAWLGQGELRRATDRELRDAGERLLGVREWRPHDPALQTLPGFPFRPVAPGAPTWWLQGTEHLGATTAPCWVPFSLVHAGYLASRLVGLAATNGHNLVGLEAGQDRSEALDRAAGRLLAQDAVARWWYDDGPALRDVALPPQVRDDDAPVALRVLAVPSPSGVPVRLAVADDREQDVVALGYACHEDPAVAAEGAVWEALVQHASASDLARPDSLIRRAPELGNGGVAGLAAHDPQRHYGAAFADRRRMIDPMCHVQYGLDPDVVRQVRRRTQPDTGPGAEPDGAPPTGSTFTRLLEAPGRVVTVDVTTSRVRAGGFCAHRVLATGLRRLTVAAFPQRRSEAQAPYPGW
ncbi:YcaO-like family protein [Isoptericola halotolerans]|uniref:YcaO-like family protein n=1 Tax=Isoptericola halotolerans TaxID=300560 RepID=UPI003890847A